MSNEIQAIKLNVHILFPPFGEKKKKCQKVASVGPGRTTPVDTRLHRKRGDSEGKRIEMSIDCIIWIKKNNRGKMIN